MYKLPMVSSYTVKLPAIIKQHVNNLTHFIPPHKPSLHLQRYK